MSKRKLSKKRSFLQEEASVPEKANKILSIALVVFLLIALRLWDLSILKHEELTKRARAPQRKTLLTKAPRGTITDRYGYPLATNKTQYNAAILYSQIRRLPRTLRKKDAEGNSIRLHPRKEHITKLSQKLGEILQEDADRIEDLIHSKAALFPQVPFVIKAGISEREFYRLKVLEKDFAGLYAERAAKRVYPQNAVAGTIVGYMGAISQEEYQAILKEKSALESFLEDARYELHPSLPPNISTVAEARKRLRELKEKAYGFSDLVGKTGVEGKFEEELRGFHGKKTFYSDSKGNFLKELPGSIPPISGKRITLSLSLELQEFAEKALIDNEALREETSKEFNWDKRNFETLKQPWIKGGGIVALDPHTGEVLALATHPRCDPNDFIPSSDKKTAKKKTRNIHRWLETETHLQHLWDEKTPFQRERVKKNGHVYQEEKYLSWNNFLDFLFVKDSPLKQLLQELNLQDAVTIDSHLYALLPFCEGSSLGTLFNHLYTSPNHIPFPLYFLRGKKSIESSKELLSAQESFNSIFQAIAEALPANQEKVLFLDCLRLLVRSENFSKSLLKKVGSLSLGEYKELCLYFRELESSIKKELKDPFNEKVFSQWRKKHFSSFLKEKRREEKERETYARPWIDYLDKQKKVLFTEHWEEIKWPALLSLIKNSSLPSELLPKNLSYFANILPKLRSSLEKGTASIHLKALQNLCSTLSFEETLVFLQSMRSYKDLSNPLLGRYPNLRKEKGVQKEMHLASGSYPLYGFNYGRSYAYQLSSTLGSIFKLTTSYAALLHKYSLCEKNSPSFSDLNPLYFIDKVERIREGVWRVGYTQSGEPIPQVYRGGRLPRTAHRNVGLIDVTSALEVSSNPYFSLLTGEVLESPEVLKNVAKLFSFGEKTGIDLPGEYRGNLPSDLERNRTGAYSFAIGQHTLLVTPLQAAVMVSSIANGGNVLKPKSLLSISGSKRSDYGEDLLFHADYPYKNSLERIGISFPLFTKAAQLSHSSSTNHYQTEVKRKVFMPEEIQSILLKGMHKVIHGSHGTARPHLLRNYKWNHPALLAYKKLKDSLVGKTSTSQVRDSVGIESLHPVHMYKTIWFTSISFEDSPPSAPFSIPNYGKADLVVVVYLRYGSSGQEAAPLAAQLVEKWRQIRQREVVKSL